jgi:hypothetical protein
MATLVQQSSGCTCCVFGVSKIEGKTPNSHGSSSVSLIKRQFGGLPHFWTNPGIKNENLTKDTKASGNRPMFKFHGDPFPLILRESTPPIKTDPPLHPIFGGFLKIGAFPSHHGFESYGLMTG